jgi:hypothetical protein
LSACRVSSTDHTELPLACISHAAVVRVIECFGNSP